MKNGLKWTVALSAVFIFLSVFRISPGLAGERPSLSKGQTVYVPVYSHIYNGDRERPFYLAVTLSLRNTDLDREITIDSADYYDSDGKLLKKYVTTPIRLGPLGATRFVVPESDKAGGSGANFIVRWTADQAASAPIIETIMIGTESQQGISFVSPGRVISED